MEEDKEKFQTERQKGRKIKEKDYTSVLQPDLVIREGRKKKKEENEKIQIK